MTTVQFSEKKLKKIARINEVVRDYFISHPTTDRIAAKMLMPIFIRKGIFVKDTDNGLPIRAIVRELYKHQQLHLLPATIVVLDKRSYYFDRKE